MKTETIVCCVVALLLGMLLANMLKNVCGCKLTEGQNQTFTYNSDNENVHIPVLPSTDRNQCGQYIRREITSLMRQGIDTNRNAYCTDVCGLDDDPTSRSVCGTCCMAEATAEDDSTVPAATVPAPTAPVSAAHNQNVACVLNYLRKNPGMNWEDASIFCDPRTAGTTMRAKATRDLNKGRGKLGRDIGKNNKDSQ